MCTNPIYISKPSLSESKLRKFADVRLNPSLRNRVWTGSARNNLVVPCGKCIQCLKSRQNDIAVRSVREAERTGSMVFVTLTYREDTVPLAHSAQFFDKDSGELVDWIKPESGRYEQQRSSVVSQSINKLVRYHHILDEDYDDNLACLHTFTPSLCRRDFRLYLKRQRINYKRHHDGVGLPDFKYVAIGEYGPKTNRPHWHCGFFGLTRLQVCDLFAGWQKDFGDVKVEQVKKINKDGSYGFKIASLYVGKYFCKGKAECESVKRLEAEKPRLMVSIDFGSVLSQQEIDYYTAQDLFGKYNLNDLSHFSEWQLDRLVQEVNLRSRVNVYGLRYGVPSIIKRKLFYRKEYYKDKRTKEKKVRYVPTQLQSLRISIFQVQLVDLCLAEFRKNFSDSPAEDFGKYFHQVFSQLVVSRALSETFGEKDFYRFYAGSVF